MNDIWRRNFEYWRLRFLRILSHPVERTAWDTLNEAGCTPEDLEFVLYWSADDRDRRINLPEQLNAFREARGRVLNDVHRLKGSFGELAITPLDGQPAVGAVWDLTEGRGRKKFESFSSVLSQFERAVEFLGVGKIGVKQSQSSSSGGEALVHVYVEQSCDRMFSESVSVLLGAASRAYGPSVLKFSLEAVSQRYSRFRRKHPQEFEELQRCVWTHRILRLVGFQEDLSSVIVGNLVEPRVLAFRKRFRRRMKA
jgi:hypothetical protein